VDKQSKMPGFRLLGLALLGVGGLLLTGCHGGDSTDTTASTTPTPGLTPGMKPGLKPGGTPGAAPDQANPLVGGAKGARGAAGGPGATPAQAGPGKTVAKADPFAAPGASGGVTPLAPPAKTKGFDPFNVTWRAVPPPPDPLASGDVQPIRVASVGYTPPPEQEVTVREVPDRRVSGIMSGDGVFAIIEQNGESEVVKPGGTTKDGYRVVAINGDSVKLEKKVGNLNYTQTVQLSDVQTGGSNQFAGRYGGAGMAGFGGPGVGQPGFGRGGLGRPGAGGGAGGSKAD
jgi:hypothetical protein